MPDPVGTPPKKITPLPSQKYSQVAPTPFGPSQPLKGLDDKGSQYENLNRYTDPNNDLTIMEGPDYQRKMIESSYDALQPWTDKLGNGMMKFAGSFSDGILSTVGTIYAIPASIITLDGTQFWDNPFNKLGDEISTSIQNNFRSYQSKEENEASAWSPKYWATMNFLSDNILGNLGFAASAWATGWGVSKVLSKLAPFIAGKSLQAGLDIINAEGIDVLKNMKNAYRAVKTWDRTQQAISVGISAAGEASVEAYGNYKETKAKMLQSAIERYGSESMIPDSIKEQMEQDAKSAANITYMLNLPVLAGADMIMWGKSLSGFNSEFKQMEKNAIRMNPMKEFGMYQAAGDEVKSGMAAALGRGLKKTGQALKANLTEAGQEGAQYLISETSKSWYARKNDPRGWNSVDSFIDPFEKAIKDLFTTKEGVSNLLGGFAGGIPFGMKDYIRAFAGDPSMKKLAEDQQAQLNNPFPEGTLRENLKIYLQNMARHASAEQDLQQALMDGDEHKARNAKFDQLKSYINSRIQTGRMDLLEDELSQLNKLGNEEFKSFFNLDENTNLDKTQVLTRFKDTAKEMHDTYKMMDRLFMPDMYKLNKLSDEDKDSKLADLSQYKQNAWSYMMDYKDRDKRAKLLDAELTKTLGGLINVGELMGDKFKSDELNHLYRQYVAASVDVTMNKRVHNDSKGLGPSLGIYNTGQDVAKAEALKQRLRDKIEEMSKGNVAGALSVKDFQDMGKKDFVEEYLFNLDKRLMPVLNEPAVRTAIDTDGGRETLINKIYDLASLHNDRVLAIHSYNQLAAAVKSGQFMERFMDNPEYDKEKHAEQPEFIKDKESGSMIPNPEYQPERIPSNKMLDYDGYAKNKSEREEFYKEKQAKEEQNRVEATDFETEITEATDATPNDKNKEFHKKAKKFQRDLSKMTDLDLQRHVQMLTHESDRLSEMGHFDTSTKRGRDTFDKEHFIDINARIKAANDEIARRNTVHDKRVSKRAKEIVKYVYANKIPIENVQFGFEIEGQRVSNEIITAVQTILQDKERKKREAKAANEAEKEAALQVGKKPSTDNEDIINDELWAEFVEKKKINPESLGSVIPDLADKIIAGTGLSEREAAVYEKYKTMIDKRVAKASEIKDLKPSPKETAIKVQEPTPGAIINQKSINKEIQEELEKEVKDIKPISVLPGYIKLRRRDTEFTYEQGESYDENGNVIPHKLLKESDNFSLSLFGNADSPINFHRHPQVKFVYTNRKFGIKKEPEIDIYVSSDGKAWTNSGYQVQGLYNTVTGDEIKLGEFVKGNEVLNAERQAEYKKTITAIQQQAVKDGFVMAEIKGDPTFGYLIPNKKDEQGNPEWKPLTEAMGAAPFNQPNNPFSVLLGVMYNNDEGESKVVIYDERDENLKDINLKPKVEVPQVLLNKIGSLKERRSNASVAGQVVAMVPTGKMNGDKQVRFPVILNGSLLNTHLSAAYNIGSGANQGTEANMGEVLIDALLNPHKDEHQELMPQLFKLAGNLEYKGIDKSDWNSFYTQENMDLIINKVFFASCSTYFKDSYSLPFRFQVMDRSDDHSESGIKSKVIRLGITDGMLNEKNTKEIDIFVVGKEGQLMIPKSPDAQRDFVQFRIDNERRFRKDKGLKERAPITYEEIQSVIKRKAFRTPVKELTAVNPEAYTGFVFDDKGKLTTQTFNSYIDYSDHMGIITSNIQSIKNGKGGQQFFINQEVYFSPKLEATVTTKSPVKTKKKTEGEDDIADMTLGSATTGVVWKQEPSAKAQENIRKQNEARSKKGNSAIRSVTQLRYKKPGNGAQPMLAMDAYRSTLQSRLVADASVTHYSGQVTKELSTIMFRKLMRLRTNNKSAVNVQTLKAMLKDELNRMTYDIVKSVRPILKDVTYEKWLEIPSDKPEAQYLTENEIDNIDEEKLKLYEAITFGLAYYDHDELKKDVEAGNLLPEVVQQITTGDRIIGYEKKGRKSVPITEPEYFIGFSNLALQRLTNLGIVRSVNESTTEVSLEEDGPDYMARTNDSWALQINPKDTLGMQSKIFIHLVPSIVRNKATGQWETVLGRLGTPELMDPNLVGDTLYNIGQAIDPLEFEYEIMNNPVREQEPVVAALRMELNRIKSEDKGLYKQILKQVANTYTTLRANNVQILEVETGFGKAPSVKIMSGARTNIGNQVTANWQSQYLMLSNTKDFYFEKDRLDEDAQVLVPEFEINNDVEFQTYQGNGKYKAVRGNFADVYRSEIKRIFDVFRSGTNGELSEDGYFALGATVKNILGLDLVESDWDSEDSKLNGKQTALAIKSLNEVYGNKKQRRIMMYAGNNSEIKDFQGLFKTVIGDHIANQMKRGLELNSYDPENPFKESTKAFDLLSKIFKGYQKSVQSEQAHNINGDNEYTRILSEMFTRELRSLKREDEMRRLAALPIGKYHPFLNEQFAHEQLDMAEYWQEMKTDIISGIQVKNGQYKSIIDARKAAAADIDLLSMLFYQGTENKEKVNSKTYYRGMTRYYMPFSDSSTAHSFEFGKFGFQFDYNGKQLKIKGKLRDTVLYGLFKSEVNRVKSTFDQFNDKKPQELDENYHYQYIDGELIPGSGARLYYWGKERNELTDDLGLYDTIEINNRLYPTGLKDGIINDETGELDDTKLKAVFDSFIDDFMGGIVSGKIEEMSKHVDSFFKTPKRQAENGKYLSPKLNNLIFGKQYRESIENLFKRDSTINGILLDDYKNDKEWDTAEQAQADGYHMQLLKAMIIDHQVNHMIAATQMQQLTWDYAAFDLKGNWRGFVDNMAKREKGFASPGLFTASNSNVRIIGYEDVKFGHQTTKIEKTEVLDQYEGEVLKFMENHPDLKTYINFGVENQGEYHSVPAQYKRLALTYYAQKQKGTPDEKIASILKDMLESDITDGGTVITLQEYLFQQLEQGQIQDHEYFKFLKTYNDPNLEFSTEDAEKLGLTLKAQKMVLTGSKIDGDRKVPFYVKDGKMVLIPSQAKGTMWESIIHDLGILENNPTNVPAPGIHLAPKSALKSSNVTLIRLFDENGNVNLHRDDVFGLPVKHTDSNRLQTAIMGAKITEVPRSMYGTQVQNPDKNKNEVTSSAQMLKNMILNIPDSYVLGKDLFTSNTLFKKTTGKTYGADQSEDKDIISEGVTKLQAVGHMISLIREMRERKLQSFIDKFGLDYNISEAWKQAKIEDGSINDKVFDTRIAEMVRSKDPEIREKGKHLQFIKYDTVVRTLYKMMQDIRQQAISRKNMDISQLKVLDAIMSVGEGTEEYQRLQVPLTFTPGNKQYQEVILAEIQKLFAGVKMNGAGFIQATSFGHRQSDETGLKSKVRGDLDLKDYALTYDAEGKVNGFTPAEVIIPWVFRDKTGKLLDYKTYLNEDGTIRVDKNGKPMIDEDLLNLIGFRIPNTGMNMAGRFRIKKFLKPGYSDAILIPASLYAQWGTDLDFDKLYTYLYNTTIGEDGVLTSTKGVISMRQRDADKIINSPQALDHAVEYLLKKDDPSYRHKYNLFQKAYKAFSDKVRNVKAEIEDEDGIISNPGEIPEDGESSGLIRQKLEDVYKRLRAEEGEQGETLVEKDKRIKTLEQQYKSIVDAYTELSTRKEARKKNFDMEKFLTDGSISNPHLKAQSYEQLENAYMQMYHMFMSDPASIPTMFTPLTSKMITDEIAEKKFDGKSIVESSEINQAPPNTEAGRMTVAARVRMGNVMIGSFANASFSIHLAQTGKLMVGNKTEEPENPIRPVVFKDEKGKVILEDNNNDHFVSNVGPKPGYKFTPMHLINDKGEVLQVPYKLYRTRDLSGTIVPKEQSDSFLQGFLDLLKDPTIIYANVNKTTMNAAVIMGMLGYNKFLIPFMQQQILKEYAARDSVSRSPVFNAMNEDMSVVTIKEYLQKAGLESSIPAFEVLAPALGVGDALAEVLTMGKVGDAKFGYHKFFSIKELNDMVNTQLHQKTDISYYKNQLHIMDMFLRLNRIGSDMLGLQLSSNLDSKGFKEKNILGVQDQMDNVRKISDRNTHPTLIGSEKLGIYGKRNKGNIDHPASVAFTILNKAANFLLYNPEKNNMFSDATPAFATLRDMLVNVTGKNNTANKARYNISIIKYMLSNPELYSNMLDVIPKEARTSADQIRKYIFTDVTEEKTIKGKTKQITHPSLARSIEMIANERPEKDSPTYKELYPVLNYFKTMVQAPGKPSWVYNFNTNQFKESAANEIPYNILTMLHDENTKIQAIAKKLYLYYYMGQGVTSPESFGHLLPQEKLFEPAAFAETLNSMLDDLNKKMKALREEANAIPTEYDRPSWFRIMDSEYITFNKEASIIAHGQMVQHFQHNPSDVPKKFYEKNLRHYTEGVEFEAIEGSTNTFRLSEAGQIEMGDSVMHNVPVFMDGKNVYVINRDYNTYTRVTKAGARRFSEYSYGKAASNSPFTRNAIILEDEDIDNMELGTETTLEQELEPVQTPEFIQKDKPVELKTILSWGVESMPIIAGEDINVSKRKKELQILTEALMPLFPANVTVMPYSIAKAKKDFGSRDGELMFDQNTPAYGLHHPGTPNSTIDLAFEYADKHPNAKDGLFLREIMTHEAAHVATSNVFKLIRLVREDKMTRKEFANAIGLKADPNDQIPLGGMVSVILNSFEDLSNTYDFLKNSRKLYDTYVDIMKQYGQEESQSASQLKMRMSDMDEMVAYLFNDRNFRQALNRIEVPTKHKTFFGKILDLIKKVLGLNPGHAAYEIFNSVFDITEPLSTNSMLSTQGWSEEGLTKLNLPANKKQASLAQPMISGPLYGRAVKSDDEGFFYMRSYNPEDLSSGKKTISVRPEKLKTGIYKFGEDYYRVSLRGYKKIGDLKENADTIKSKSVGANAIQFAHIQAFYDNKIPMYVYDISKVNYTQAMSAEFVGAMKINRDEDGLVGNDAFDSYITALTDYISRLEDERRAVAGDKKKVQEYTERIKEQQDSLDSLQSNKTVRHLVNIGTQQVNRITDQMTKPMSLLAMQEGIRIAKAWSELDNVIDFLKQDATDEEADVIATASKVQVQANAIVAELLNKTVQEIIRVAESHEINVADMFDDNNNLLVKDIKSLEAYTISGAYSSNQVDWIIEAVSAKQRFAINEEIHQVKHERDQKGQELLGNAHAHADFMMEEVQEPVEDETGKISSVKKVSLVTMYDRDFLNEWHKKESDAHNKKIKWKEFYAFERNHFDYQLTEEGQQAFDEYMAAVKQDNILGVTEEGEILYDDAAIEKVRQENDPQVFQEYLDGHDSKGKIEFNKGATWFTKTPKNVKFNTAYANLSEKQKEYYHWFTDTYMKYYNGSHVDYRLGPADLDTLLMDFSMNTIEGIGNKAKYIGAAAVEWLKGTYMVTATSTKSANVARALTGATHIAAQSKPIAHFLPENGLKANPVEILTKFVNQSIAFRRKREVEELFNTINDIMKTASKIEENNSGQFMRRLSGEAMTSTNKTLIAQRLEATVQGFLTDTYSNKATTSDDKQPGEKGFSLVKTIDSVNKLTRLRYMAWSPLSATGNFLMGCVNNFTYAATGEYFNDKELMQAVVMLKWQPAKFISDIARKDNGFAHKEARLIAEIMTRYNIIGDVTEEMLYGDDKLAKFFALQKGGEFLVQGATALAQLIHTKVKLKDGTEKAILKLFELDETGNVVFKSELLDENDKFNNPEQIQQLFDRIKAVNEKIHGDYSHVMLGKKYAFGRMLAMFRTWLPMAVKDRFGAEYTHRILGKQKGRYRSAWHVLKAVKATEEEGGGFSMTGLTDVLKIIGKMIPFARKHLKLSDRVSDVDRKNIDMFVRETQMMLMITLSTLMLKMNANDDEDDPETKSLMRYLFNQGLRLENELSMFYTPTSFNQIMQSIVPLTSTLTDAQKVVTTGWGWMVNNEKDKYVRGFRKDHSKFGTAIQQFLPVTRSAQSVWSAFSQTYGNNPGHK